MYLDPGFGGMLVQIVIALVAVSGALFFAFRKKISSFFKKKKPVGNVSPTDSASMVSEEDIIDTMSDNNENN